MSVVSEESENIYGQRSKSAVYNDAKAEKEVRSTLKSAVLRVLSKDGVVILDSLNYIKGMSMYEDGMRMMVGSSTDGMKI